MSDSVRRIDSFNSFNTNISTRLPISDVKVVYSSTHNVDYIWQMLKYNDCCICLDNVEETLLYVAIQDWFDIDSVNVFNLLSAANKWQNSLRPHVLHIHQC